MYLRMIISLINYVNNNDNPYHLQLQNKSQNGLIIEILQENFTDYPRAPHRSEALIHLSHAFQ